jgi:hypothetical protein
VAAVSVGIVQGTPLLDLEYTEDSACDTDMNVVMTGAGGFVEVQGTAEGAPSRAPRWTRCWRWPTRASASWWGDANNVRALLEQMQGIDNRRAAMVSTLVAVRSATTPSR